MRFLFGLVVGIALTIAAAGYHDNNLAQPPRTLADRPIVNWDVLGQVTRDTTDVFGRFWDQLMGRNRQP